MSILNLLKRYYFDWRYWNYIYKNMKKHGEKCASDKMECSYNSYFDKPGITFSIDDSFRVKDWYKYGKELFGFYDVKVTFNINAFHHYEGRRGHSQEEIDMLLELQSNGHEIAHHGYNHKNVVDYSKQMGLSKWLEDEIELLFSWMEKQAHSKTGEKFKKPVTFAFPYFKFDDQTLSSIVPRYFKIARGHLSGNYLTPFNHTGFAPSICIDSHYLANPANMKKVLSFVKESGCNLILTCHSILPEDMEWGEFGWQMEEHEKRWRTSPKILQSIINEAIKKDLKFYTTAEVGGIATFIDRNFEKYIRQLLSIPESEWITISELGSIKQLDLSNQNITNIDGIQYFLNLEELDIRNNNISDLRLLEKLPRLVDVKFDKKLEMLII